jgi:hypothetical protein
VDSGPTAYSITATGYGSNWKYNPVDGRGETTLQLTVTLGTAGINDNKLGPIVTLVDADGTKFNYAWYGRGNGRHVLTMPVASPSSAPEVGTKAGLDLATLTHLHLQLDPSSYTGQYTVSWEDLRLTGAPPLAITSTGYDRVASEFSLTWTSRPGRTYAVTHAPTLAAPFEPLLTDIPSGGAATSATVALPAGDTGFLRVEEK